MKSKDKKDQKCKKDKKKFSELKCVVKSIK